MADYTIAENYTLPSHGLVYDADVNPNIKLRSMTVREEMKRLSPSTDGSIYRNMAEIIDACLVEKPGISSYDMCIGDYQFLLHKLRIVTYGPEYKVDCRCPVCGDIDEYIINLENLELLELKEFDKETLLKITLPVSKKVVELNLTTPRMLDTIEKEVNRVKKQYKKQNKEASDMDWHLLYQLVYSIKTVDGEKLSLTQKETFCNSLVGRDYNTIIQSLQRLDEKVGLGANVELTCSQCGFEINVPFRVTSEFFRPTDSD
jgi:hypothetical protein